MRIALESLAPGSPVSPLDWIEIGARPGDSVLVLDGQGDAYFSAELDQPAAWQVGGALGWHRAEILTEEGDEIVVTFRVAAETSIRDHDGVFRDLLQMLHYTMVSEFGESSSCLWNGKIYQFFICWLRDHVHVLKGMKYFHGGLKSAIELYRDTQREDGMVFDNCYPRGLDENTWVVRFTEGGFYLPSQDRRFEMKRIPVENDVEYLYVEGIYYTWKATGDEAWMEGMLDSATRALEYSVHDVDYRYSEKFGLLKRGYTIDTWDFQSEHDRNVEGDIMRVRPGTTRFGVMHGDNTGYAAACRQLAEMLERVGREEEADRYRHRGDEILARLETVSWVGTHYRHHVREETTGYDFGVDEASQVSLSNAYSMNRGIGQDKMRAIAKTYQGIRNNLPVGSPGEWYTIYPPFERGFGGHSDKWQYMNASVTPIVAGELARGAFGCGEEAYAADILLRLRELGKAHGDRFQCSYTGSIPPPPSRTFAPLDLSPAANGNPRGPATEDVHGWSNSPNDLQELPGGLQDFSGVPFEVLSEARAAIVARDGGSHWLDVEGFHSSLYLLHCMSGGTTEVAGTLYLEYEDGTETCYVRRGQEILSWWMPELPPIHGRRKLDIGWKGKNEVLPYVGVSVGAFDLDPSRKLLSVGFGGTEDGAEWWVMGATLSDAPSYFPTLPISFGIPNGWGAAAVVYALVEGLAGVVDVDGAFQSVEVSPRWTASGTKEVDVCVAYPASGGYVAYQFRHDPDQKRFALTLTGSGQECRLRVLLPPGVRTASARETTEGESLPVEVEIVGESGYATLDVSQAVPLCLEVQYS